MAVQFLTKAAYKPIYLFGGGGILLMIASFIGVLFLTARKFIVGTDVATSPFFTIFVMAGLMGGQSILMGLIAELLVRTYHESQAKPTYTVRKVWRDGKEGK